QGTQGSDLYARAIGKATGIRQIRYHQPDAGQVAAHLTQHAVAFEPAQCVSLIDGAGQLFILQSPAGLRIEILATG
ncbi:MAG: hypothetical protein AAF270_03490, partial [Pseudomonadota bacterium]